MSGEECSYRCFLCLNDQDISNSDLIRHLASHHRISNEVIILLTNSHEKRQEFMKGFLKLFPEEAMAYVGENQESVIQDTPPASPKEEIASMVGDVVKSSPAKSEPEKADQDEKNPISTERSEAARDEEEKMSERTDASKKKISPSADVKKPKVPKRPVLKSRVVAVATEEVKTKKRRSLMMCENLNAVSNRIQFWKTRETVEKDSDTSGSGSSEMSISPTKKNSENLVNKLLKQQTRKTTVDDNPPFQESTPSKVVLMSGRSADDTISRFDDIYTAVCPGESMIMDDNIESKFNMIYDEEGMDLRTRKESIDGEAEGLVTPLRNEEASPEDDCKPLDLALKTAIRCDEDEDYEEEVSRQRDISYVSSIVESIEKVSKPNETEEGSEAKTSTPTSSSDVDKSTCNSLEKVEGMYKCDDCGKDFKFLTYLKGHKSKSGCINSNSKKKRPSMNFSKIVY